MTITVAAAPEAAARRIYSPVQKDGAVFLETAAESGGARTVLEIDVAPGGGNRPHRHLTLDEHFEVLRGTLTLRVGDAKLRIGPGERATAPIGASHCFTNDTRETVVFRVVFEPGHRGTEEALQAAYGMAEDGLMRSDGTPRNPLHLAVLAQWSDIGLDGPLRLMTPLLGLLGRIARRRGVDRDLRARYVRF
jgi:mannose-6-phosphate isomerase-like protein (cupin superfamily)